VSHGCEERGKRGAGKRGGGGDRGALKGARQLALWIGMGGGGGQGQSGGHLSNGGVGGPVLRRGAQPTAARGRRTRAGGIDARRAKQEKKKGVRLGTLRVGRHGLVQNEQ
jgi:hypothetical protein